MGGQVRGVRKGKRKLGTDIRKHRFVPTISTTSKVFKDGKSKSRSRASLKKRLNEELSEEN